MIIWVDAQLSPALASWMGESFSLNAKALRELGLRDASDERIFFAAREASQGPASGIKTFNIRGKSSGN